MFEAAVDINDDFTFAALIKPDEDSGGRLVPYPHHHRRQRYLAA